MAKKVSKFFRIGVEGDTVDGGGEFSSNGVVVDKHTHGGVLHGGDNTDKPA